ncbi:hypothetical protein DGG96_07275 [Legionella qingyii]|uniref:Uncharacterized protein n=1 Tax=Legionella qingyii TaxID=2184757 RepID=A0A317U673_9GAMM|nr:hypothetical protein DGG96_07275 [Legionella qingyii]
MGHGQEIELDQNIRLDLFGVEVIFLSEIASVARSYVTKALALLNISDTDILVVCRIMINLSRGEINSIEHCGDQTNGVHFNSTVVDNEIIVELRNEIMIVSNDILLRVAVFCLMKNLQIVRVLMGISIGIVVNSVIKMKLNLTEIVLDRQGNVW